MREVIGFLLFFGGVGTALAEGEHHRQVEAHEHGSSALNVAIEGETLFVEFRAPAHDIIGFEHTPENPDEREAVDDAREILSDGLALFGIPDAADCAPVEQEVEAHFGSAEADDQEHESEHERHDSHGKDDDHASHEEHDEEDHAEFHATYEFSCETPSNLGEWQVSVFEEFTNATEIHVQAVSENGQMAEHLSRKNSTLDLSDILN